MIQMFMYILLQKVAANCSLAVLLMRKSNPESFFDSFSASPFRGKNLRKMLKFRKNQQKWGKLENMCYEEK